MHATFPVTISHAGRAIPAEVRQGCAPGTFLVWALDSADAPKSWCGSILTDHALIGPIDAVEVARRFPDHATAIHAVPITD